MRIRFLAFALLLSSQIGVAASAQELFDVVLQDVPSRIRVLHVGFHRKLPAPAVVDRILRQTLEHAVLVDSTVDILATAWLDDDPLDSNQYSGRLVYKAKDGKILTWAEHGGVKTTTSNTSGYFVEVEEQKSPAGIRAQRKWLSVSIVFAKAPNQATAHDAIVAETRKLASRALDVNLYVMVGDKNVKTSWVQLKDTSGGYVAADYDAAKKQLTSKDRTLTQL